MEGNLGGEQSHMRRNKLTCSRIFSPKLLLNIEDRSTSKRDTPLMRGSVSFLISFRSIRIGLQEMGWHQQKKRVLRNLDT